jgi:hypothetical protein
VAIANIDATSNTVTAPTAIFKARIMVAGVNGFPCLVFL